MAHSLLSVRDHGVPRFHMLVTVRDFALAQLSASGGIVPASDPREAPKDIRNRADREMYRAKERSKDDPAARTCVLAVEGREPEVIA